MATTRWADPMYTLILDAVVVRMESPMRSSPEQRLRDLLEAAPDAIIEVDREGQIVLLNGMTEKLFGYEREELLGQPVEVLIPQHLRATHVHNRSAYWTR